MKIITCFKLVPEEQDIVVTPEYTLNFDNADAKISQFDLNAIEAASQLATDDDEIAALTVGGSLLQNSKVRKDVLSRGPHSLYLVQDAQLEHALPLDTAKALAAAIEKIGFDLLIFGEGSGDLYAQQVGLLVGEILQLPVINAVSAIQRQGNTLVIERTLEDDVEVGSCTTIDNATMGSTLVRRGTKIDNLVHLGHNVEIGEDCFLIAQVGTAARTKRGNHVIFAGQTGCTGHITIGDNVQFAGKTGITGNVPSNSIMAGYPMRPHKEWLKLAAYENRLPDMVKTVKQLQKEIDALKAQLKES